MVVDADADVRLQTGAEAEAALLRELASRDAELAQLRSEMEELRGARASGASAAAGALARVRGELAQRDEELLAQGHLIAIFVFRTSFETSGLENYYVFEVS